jgi:hypothetical protein
LLRISNRERTDTDDMATPKPQAAPIARRAYSINEACIALDICRATAYAMMLSGALPYVEYGGRRHIPADIIEALVKGEHPSQGRLTPERPGVRAAGLSPEQIAKAIKRRKPNPVRRRVGAAA